MPSAKERSSRFIQMLTDANGAVVPYSAFIDAGVATSRQKLSEVKGKLKGTGFVIGNQPNVGYQLISMPPAQSVPQPPDPMFGRKQELQDVREAIGRGRLVTLVAWSGYGKSAIARRVAHDLQARGGSDWPREGVVYVEFERRRPEEVIAAIAGQLGVVQGTGGPYSVANALANRELLIVLDQVEHVREELVPFLTAALENAPGVGFLVTSWRRFGEGLPENAIPILGLGGENGEDAVDLFTAMSQRRHARIPAEDLPQVADLCSHLLGNPGLIKAAVQANSRHSLSELREMTVEDNQERLFQRQFELFPPETQDLLARLSVFTAPFPLSRTTAGIVGLPLDELHTRAEAEIELSLQVVWTSAAERPRYRLDHQIRQPASDHLSGDPELRRAVDARLFNTAQSWAVRRPGQDQLVWLQRIDREHDTIETALTRHADLDGEAGNNLARALVDMVVYWRVRGRFQDGRSTTGALLKSVSARSLDDVTITVRACAAVMRYLLGEQDKAREAIAELPLPKRPGLARAALAYARALILSAYEDEDDDDGGPASLRFATSTLRAWALYGSALYPEAEERFRTVAIKAEEEGDTRAAVDAMIGLAWVLRRQCKLDDAEYWIGKAQGRAEPLDDAALLTDVLNARAEFVRCRRDVKSAYELLEQAQEITDQRAVQWLRGRILGSRGEVVRTRAGSKEELFDADELLRQSLQEAIAWNRRTDQSWRHFGLGFTASIREDYDEAEKHFRKSLELAGREPADPWQVARARQRLARLTLRDGQPLEATRELTEIAVIQARLSVLDDLSWTLLDLEVAMGQLGRHDAVATLHGARLATIARASFGHADPESDLGAVDPWKAQARESIQASRAAIDAASWHDAEQAGRALATPERIDDLAAFLIRLLDQDLTPAQESDL